MENNQLNSNKTIDKTMSTSNIAYNYKIAKALFDNTTNLKKIRNEIVKLIQLQIDLIIAYYQLTETTEKEKLDKLTNVFFKNNLTEQGQLGIPRIFVNGTYKNIQTIEEFRVNYVNSLNFREIMSMMRNFASAENDCIMYSILIEYSEANNSQNSQTDLDAFKNKYPMLNVDLVNEAIIMIEKIIGFDISETAKCYDNLHGNEERRCTNNTKPYYKMVQDAHLQQKTQPSELVPKSPITLCWLWHPLVYGIPYQDVVKLSADNFVKRLNNSYKPVKDEGKQGAKDCMIDTYTNYPIFPPLSQREQNYFKSQQITLTKGVDGQYTNPPWNPPTCYMERADPPSFMINLLDRNKKYSVSNLSGHVMKFIMIAKYFKSNGTNETNGTNGTNETIEPINLDMIILASILFMVPYNHSIHEIFQASKAMDVNINYSIKDTDLVNINRLLEKNGMNMINPSIQSISDTTTDTKRISNPPIRTNLGGSMNKRVRGNLKRKTKRKLKHRTRNTRLRKQPGYTYNKKTHKTKKSKKICKSKRTKK